MTYVFENDPNEFVTGGRKEWSPGFSMYHSFRVTRICGRTRVTLFLRRIRIDNVLLPTVVSMRNPIVEIFMTYF